VAEAGRRSGRRAWWTAVLFAAGSLCFVVGPLPGFIQLVGAQADAAVFFAGSVLFTAAATLQLAGTPRGRRTEWSAGAVQLAGTVLFNVSTYDALDTTLSVQAENRVVWAPDLLGSICFLVASGLAWQVARRLRPGTRDRRVAALNLGGSVLFGISAVAAYVVPARGTALDLAAANVTTSAGALCFLAGAVLLLRARVSPASEDVGRRVPPDDLTVRLPDAVSDS
jgi:YrhK-like protein